MWASTGFLTFKNVNDADATHFRLTRENMLNSKCILMQIPEKANS